MTYQQKILRIVHASTPAGKQIMLSWKFENGNYWKIVGPITGLDTYLTKTQIKAFNNGKTEFEQAKSKTGAI